MSLSRRTFLIAGAIVVTIVVTILENQSVNAQSSIRECLSEFVRQGVSPDKAADLCSSSGLAQERCVEKKRFRTYEGTPRNREDGRTEYIYPMNAFTASNVTGSQCWTDFRNFFNPTNICWASSIRVSLMSEEQANAQCRENVGGNPSPALNGNQFSGSSPVIIIPGGGGSTLTSPIGGGSPQAIQQCMENLLYRTEVQKPFPSWICVANDVNCRTVRVRTEISESAAVQACQNAR